MATLTAPALLVTGAAVLPLPYGLFSAVSFRPGGDLRWTAGGVSWEALPCGDGPAVIGHVYCDDEPVGIPREFSSALAEEVGSALTFTVSGRHVCSPLGTTEERAAQLASDRLINGEERAAETRLWENLEKTAPSADFSYYQTPDGLLDAIARLEAAQAATGHGLGIIHLSRRNASLAGKHLVERGGRLYTTLGTPVVAGSGYGERAAFLSPQLVAYRSEVEGRVAFDPAQNDRYAMAERAYLLGYDDCAVARVDLNPAP